MLCLRTVLQQMQGADVPTTLRLIYRRELRPLTRVLADDERVLAAALGYYQQRTSMVLASDRRCIVVGECVRQPAITLIPYATVRSVAWTADLVYGSLTLRCASGAHVITRVCPGGYAERLAWHIEQRRRPG